MNKKLILVVLPILMLCLQATVFTQKPQKKIPFVRIEGIKYSVISKDSLMHVDSLTCSDEQFKIISFTMTTTIPNSDVWNDSSTSNLMTKTMKQMIHRAVSGQRIWFENIKAKGTDSEIRFLEAITLRVE